MKLGRKPKTEQYGGIRRKYTTSPHYNPFFFVHLHLGRNSKACAVGHNFAGKAPGLCHCGKPVKHYGFYKNYFYGVAGLDIYILGIQFHAWVNNEGSFGAYWKVWKYILGLPTRGWYGGEWRRGDVRWSILQFYKARPY